MLLMCVSRSGDPLLRGRPGTARVAAVPMQPGSERPRVIGCTASTPFARAGRRIVDHVDNRSEVRDFLTSRRARLTPKDAGLPTLGAARRVKGLRREEVATLAGVSVEYYSRMERGGLGGVSESVLEAVAAALQLDDAERAHLFDLAGPPTPASARAGRRRERACGRLSSCCSTV